MPVLGTAAIIIFAHPGNLTGRLLASKPMVGIGLISYSAYLWHQPILAFARTRDLDALSTSTLILLCALSLLVAYISWRFIEQPFRNKKKFSRSLIFSGATIVSAALISFGVADHLARGVWGRLDRNTVQMFTWRTDLNPRKNECHSTLRHFISPEESCAYGKPRPVRIAIWGDSHAMAVANELGHDVEKFGSSLRELSYSGCLPVLEQYNVGRSDQCADYNREAYRYLLNHDNIKTVVLHGRYTLKTMGHRFNNHDGGIEAGDDAYSLPIGKSWRFINDPERVATIGRLYRKTVTDLLQHGKRVVLVYTVPEVGWNVPEYLAREYRYGIHRDRPLSTSYHVYKNRTRVTHAQLDMIPDDPNLIRIHPERIFCNSVLANRCAAEIDGKPLYADDDHLDSIGAGLLADLITKRMQERGWLPDNRTAHVTRK